MTFRDIWVSSLGTGCASYSVGAQEAEMHADRWVEVVGYAGLLLAALALLTGVWLPSLVAM